MIVSFSGGGHYPYQLTADIKKENGMWGMGLPPIFRDEWKMVGPFSTHKDLMAKVWSEADRIGEGLFYYRFGKKREWARR